MIGVKERYKIAQRIRDMGWENFGHVTLAQCVGTDMSKPYPEWKEETVERLAELAEPAYVIRSEIKPTDEQMAALLAIDREGLLDLADLMEGSRFEYSGEDKRYREISEFMNGIMDTYAKCIRKMVGEETA